MTTRLLDFADYIGGPDTIVLEMFPRMQRKYTYNFGGNISGYQFTADYQSLVLSEVTYDRVTGDPNFSTTTILGSFPTVSNVSNTLITVTNAASGFVDLTIPENRYTGNIIPDARTNVVGTVLTFQWQTSSASTAVKDAHRYLILERYEPGVPIGDPTLGASFVPLVITAGA
jgi:hypothetical protein